MKYLLTSILILTSFLTASDPRERLMELKKMDRDGNKAISFKEYSYKPVKIFKNMDSDSNGVLTYSEFSLKKLRPSRMMRKYLRKNSSLEQINNQDLEECLNLVEATKGWLQKKYS